MTGYVVNNNTLFAPIQATAAVSETDKEWELTKMTLKYIVGILTCVCVWTLSLMK